MRSFRVLCLLMFFILAVSHVSFGKVMDKSAPVTGPVDISALFLEHKREENVYIAKGNVDIKEGTRALNADSVIYNDETKEVYAEGNVVFKDGEDVVECERLQLNLLTKTGTIEKGKIYTAKGNFTITGDKMEKIGDQRYTITNCTMTTCEGETPPWRFVAKDVDLTVEGYAKAKGTMFQIKNKTVFYFPWGVFPVKTERQSGFLLPEINLSSRDGIDIKNHYFWAISKDKDATFGLEFIEDRGFKPSSEFRYALRDDLKGSLFFSIIDDKDYERTRYQLKAQHEQLLPANITLKLKADHVSDMDYLQDFGETVTERSENSVKSTVYAEKPLKRSLVTYEMSYFKTLTQRNNDYTMKYLPFVSFFTEFIPLLKERFYTDIYSDFTNFYREEGDTSSRLSIEPRFRFPYSWHGINTLVNGTLYETAYLTKYEDNRGNKTEHRQLAKIEADANVQFLKNYQIDYFNIGEVQSLIKPRVRYTFIPNSSYKDIPDIDPYDRIYKTNAITYGLTHYLNTFSPDNIRELSLFEIEQTYSLSEDLKESTLYKGYGERLSDVTARLTIWPIDNFSFSHESTFSTTGEGIRIMRNSLEHSIPKLYKASLSHSYTKDLTNELYWDLIGYYRRLEGRYVTRYSFLAGELLDATYRLTYRPTSCWAVTLSLVQSTRPNDTRVKISFELAGITSRND